MITQTPATSEIENWLRIRFFTNFWLRCQAKFLTSAKFLTCYCFWVILLVRIKK